MNNTEKEWFTKISRSKDLGPKDYQMLSLLSAGTSLEEIKQYNTDLYLYIWNTKIRAH